MRRQARWLVKLATLDGRAAPSSGAATWPPATALDGAGRRRRAGGGRRAVARQRSDPDLWVIEVEDRQGRTLLDEDGLSD
jgi:hypothetical protein